MSKQEDWTQEDEAAALARLIGAKGRSGPTPIVLIYTRQSQSDFDKTGKPIGPSLAQQLDSVLRRPELQGLTFEQFEYADRREAGRDRCRRLLRAGPHPPQ